MLAGRIVGPQRARGGRVGPPLGGS